MTTLTCREIDALLDAFVDSELPPVSLLDVARHAALCPDCEARIQTLTSIGHMIGTTVRADVAALDLSGVWSAVERKLDAVDAEHQRAHRWDRWRLAFSGPTLPAWGTAAAIAASAVLYLQPAATTRLAATAGHGHLDTPTNVAQIADSRLARSARNQALIERIKGSNVQVRRLPKDGTTAIWVNYSPDGGR